MSINKNKDRKDRYKKIIAQLLLSILLFENCNGLQVVPDPDSIPKQDNKKQKSLEVKKYINAGSNVKEDSSELATGMHYVSSRNSPRIINLESLDGAQGIVIPGAAVRDFSGYSVSRAGDINGDGIDDMIIGAPVANNNTGTSYVIYGSESLTSPINLATLGAKQGVVIQGAAANDQSGHSVNGAGDVNGDGIADLIIGADNANSAAGTSYVVYGSKALTSPIHLASLDATQGVVIQGAAANDQSGYSVSGAGDVNGDGIDDVIIGAPNAGATAGISYVVYGSKTLTSPINLAALNATQGMVIQGVSANDQAGSSVSGVGDVNGDGIADMIIEAPNGNNYRGVGYVVYGSKALPSSINLASLNTTQGVVIQEAVANIVSVNGAGDVNGDGIDDMIIGTPAANNNTGTSYVIYGSKALTSPINLASFGATQGVLIQGAAAFDRAGTSVSGVGDINGDGIDDVIIGTARANNNQTDPSYVVYGSKNLPSPISLVSLDATQGVVIQGATAFDIFTGVSLSGVGDINRDGIDDVIIGVPSTNNYTGTSYVVYGDNASSTTSSSSITRPEWLSLKGWYRSLKTLWAQPAVEQTLTPEAASLASLQYKCKQLIAEADEKTSDKWYQYSLEDLHEEIADMLQHPDEITKKEVKKFRGRLEGVKKDFLRKPLLERPSFFAGIKNRVEINSFGLDNECTTLLQPITVPMLGANTVAPAIGN